MLTVAPVKMLLTVMVLWMLARVPPLVEGALLPMLTRTPLFRALMTSGPLIMSVALTLTEPPEALSKIVVRMLLAVPSTRKVSPLDPPQMVSLVAPVPAASVWSIVQAVSPLPL